MKIFKLEHNEVQIEPEALLITAFRDIWKKYRNKEYAKSELAYIWYVGSYSSDFASHIDGEVRRAKVLQEVYGGDMGKLKIDDKTEIAIAKLEELQTTPALSFLKTALNGMEKVRKFIDEKEIDEDGDGKDAELIMKIINTAPAVIDKVRDAEKKIKQEEAEADRIQGGRAKSIFEDGIE
jgi:hypothetical protein